MGPGPPPLGSWGASQGLPGGGPGPKLQGSIRVTSPPRPIGFASKFMSILMTIFGRFGLDLGSLLGVIFGHVGAFSAQVGPGTIFEPSYLRKCDCSRNMLFANTFVCQKLTSRWGQDRPKIVPRRVQDRLGLLFFLFDLLDFDGP